MSRKVSSSAPCSSYLRAISTGSPASRSFTKLTPFTTRPSVTSRQGMMRLARPIYVGREISGKRKKVDEARRKGGRIAAGRRESNQGISRGPSPRPDRAPRIGNSDLTSYTSCLALLRLGCLLRHPVSDFLCLGKIQRSLVNCAAGNCAHNPFRFDFAQRLNV